MRYQKLGRSGLEVSRICLGCMTYGTPDWRPWVLDQKESRQFFARALELGVNFFDTADMYSQGVSEQITGRMLGEMANRDDVVIATKVYFPMGEGPNDRGLSRKHISAAIDASLQRLGTDHVDLYQIHRFDPDTPIEETLEALHDVVKSGKVRYIGASSMYAWQLAKMLYTADRLGLTRFISMQNHYNLLYREEEREMIPLCREEGLGTIPWSPLARGLLAGKGRGGEATARSGSDDLIEKLYSEPSDGEIIARVVRAAEQLGVRPAQIALAWMLGKPGVVAPIVGATRLRYLEEAVAALDIDLDDETVEALEAPYRPHPISGHSYAAWEPPKSGRVEPR